MTVHCQYHSTLPVSQYITSITVHHQCYGTSSVLRYITSTTVHHQYDGTSPVLRYIISIIKNEEKLHAFEVMVYVEVWSPFLCSLIGLLFVYFLKMPVSPVCMVDVVLLTRNFLLLYFSFFPPIPSSCSGRDTLFAPMLHL